MLLMFTTKRRKMHFGLARFFFPKNIDIPHRFWKFNLEIPLNTMSLFFESKKFYEQPHLCLIELLDVMCTPFLSPTPTSYPSSTPGAVLAFNWVTV